MEREILARHGLNDRRRDKEVMNIRGDDKGARQQRRRSPPPRRTRKYHQLLVTKEEALAYIEKHHAGQFRYPTILRNKRRNPEAQRGKYCRFHKDHGHDIEECWHLSDVLEDLITKGYLAQFVKTEGDAAPIGVINVIQAGPPLPPRPSWGEAQKYVSNLQGTDPRWTSSNRKRKSYVREVQGQVARYASPLVKYPTRNWSVTFSPEDGECRDPEESEPIVVSALVANHKVNRILVDDGASVEIMTYEVYKPYLWLRQCSSSRQGLRHAANHCWGRCREGADCCAIPSC